VDCKAEQVVSQELMRILPVLMLFCKCNLKEFLIWSLMVKWVSLT